MRCRQSERWISNDIDGTLSGKAKARLASHLAGCASCRDYLRQMARLQGEARSLPVPVRDPDYWQNSIRRLTANLEAAAARDLKPSPRRQAPAFFPATAAGAPGFARGSSSAAKARPLTRWARAGAASLLAVAAGLYLLGLRGGHPMEVYPVAFEDQVSRLYETIGENSELENQFAMALQSSIRDHFAPADGETHHLLYGHSDYLESLSDEEVQILDSAIKTELKL